MLFPLYFSTIFPFLFFHHPPPTAIYTLSLHDALPIWLRPAPKAPALPRGLRSPSRGDRRLPDVPWSRQARGHGGAQDGRDRKSTRLNSSHRCISYAVFCLKKKKITRSKRMRLTLSVSK